MPIREFIDKYPTATTVTGIQISWTLGIEKCLRIDEDDKAGKFEDEWKEKQTIFKDIVALCLEDLDPIKRAKVENLIKIYTYWIGKIDHLKDLVK